MSIIEQLHTGQSEVSVGMPLRLTLEEYERMVDTGAFDALKHRHVQLLRGELRSMSPKGTSHHRLTRFLNQWSVLISVAHEFQISCQDPIRIPSQISEPEPDISWHKPLKELPHHPEPQDIFLLIEVAVSTVHEDLGEMADLYAQAGIQDYWVVDEPARIVHIFRKPAATGYIDHQRVAVGGDVRPLLYPEVVLNTAELFAQLDSAS
jgi:Uma2 family endonuclease